MHLTDEQLEILRAKLSAHGSNLNSKIIALQSGTILPANETDVPFAEPGEEPEVRMKRFLHVIQGKMKLIREGGPYGECKQCQAEIPFHTLEREPWREVCSSCA